MRSLSDLPQTSEEFGRNSSEDEENPVFQVYQACPILFLIFSGIWTCYSFTLDSFTVYYILVLPCPFLPRSLP